MITFSNTIEIRRPRAEVFDYLADLEHTPAWNWAIDRTERLDAGPVAVGSRYRQTRHTPAPAVEYLTITDMSPPRRLTVEGELGPFRATLHYQLEQAAEATLVRNDVELRGRGGTRLLEPVLRGRIAHSVADNLRVLRRLLEPTAAETDRAL